jgi:hypothetical protein
MSPFFPALVDELRPIRADFVADSEVVVPDDQARPIWERLTGRHVIKNPARVRQAAAENPDALFAFDLLWLNGADFGPRPLLERKAALYLPFPRTAGPLRRPLRRFVEGLVAACGGARARRHRREGRRVGLHCRTLIPLAEDQERGRRRA